jgi:hypothetical protein
MPPIDSTNVIEHISCGVQHHSKEGVRRRPSWKFQWNRPVYRTTRMQLDVEQGYYIIARYKLLMSTGTPGRQAPALQGAQGESKHADD